MINLHRIVVGTKVEGPGTRTCLWFQGCSRHCKGCFATDTWPFETRLLKSADEIVDIIVDDESSEGITILGGEPLEQIEQLIELCLKVNSIDKSIILFTGYTIDEIRKNKKLSPILNLVDVLIDGSYIESLRDFSRPMVGSKNQNFHFLTSRYKMEDFKKNKLEYRISPSGKITINGQGDAIIFCKSKEIKQ